MIITYFRSSSFNQWQVCPHKYFLVYVLGYPDHPNKAAEKGTIFHKCMELLAKYSICRADFDDDELGPIKGEWCETNIKKLLDLSYQHYSSHSKNTFTYADWSDILKWLGKALAEHNGAYDPRKKSIFSVEQRFDFEIDEDWAKYSYEWDSEKLEGNLRMRGTIDLIANAGKNSVEVLDYKTGQRKDFATGKVKELKDFYKDPQLRLYHYAISKIFPQFEHILMSIYYVKDGGCFTVPFDKDSLIETKEMLRKRFLEIRQCERPKLLSNTQSDWRCKNLCYFCKNKADNGQTLCAFLRDEIQKKGLDTVVDEYKQEGHTPHFYRAPGST